MSINHLELPWLVGAPPDFRKACAALSPGDADVGARVQELASFRLTNTEAGALGRAIERLRSGGASLKPLQPFKLAILPGATFDMVAQSLPAAAARSGVLLDVVLAQMDQVEQQALDPQSQVCRSGADAVLLAVDHNWLALAAPAHSAEDAQARVAGALARLKNAMAALSAHCGAPSVVLSLAVPPLPLFGSYDRQLAFTPRRMIETFNVALPELCEATGAILFDAATLANMIGTAAWFDPRLHHLYKVPFSTQAIPLFCDAFGRLLGAIRGRSRKCLVLDLDNTCWGGVIGDDGVENIRIGQGNPEGEAFLAIQRYALELKARGIVLAVSSKNDDQVARQPFREHPDMLLKESDIAVFQANWQDKPSNLEAIAKALNFGLDALVFLDDNSAERAMVRRALPAVAVPELPEDPADYPATLAAAGYFEAVSFSDEDRTRADSYAANALRAEVLSRSRDLGDYLNALEMQIHFSRFDAMNRGRIGQLINKSNQFNLTTRRYSEAGIARFEQGDAAFTLQVRLRDRFSDFGMIGVAICCADSEAAEPTWLIDTWVMSCRVLGRKVEEAMLAAIAQTARRAGVAILKALYIPTSKNGMVSEHFDKLGFARVSETGEGERHYRLEIADYRAPALPIQNLAEECEKLSGALLNAN